MKIEKLAKILERPSNPHEVPSEAELADFERKFSSLPSAYKEFITYSVCPPHPAIDIDLSIAVVRHGFTLPEPTATLDGENLLHKPFHQWPSFGTSFTHYYLPLYMYQFHTLMKLKVITVEHNFFRLNQILSMSDNVKVQRKSYFITLLPCLNYLNHSISPVGEHSRP